MKFDGLSFAGGEKDTPIPEDDVVKVNSDQQVPKKEEIKEAIEEIKRFPAK